jgi:hypothetical protein
VLGKRPDPWETRKSGPKRLGRGSGVACAVRFAARCPFTPDSTRAVAIALAIGRTACCQVAGS